MVDHRFWGMGSKNIDGRIAVALQYVNMEDGEAIASNVEVHRYVSMEN